jgi:hypothetical protein
MKGDIIYGEILRMSRPCNTEHDNLKNAVCETIHVNAQWQDAQDVSDNAKCKAKTTDLYR